MAHKTYLKIIELVLKAQKIAQEIGIQNLLQPGLVKEMIIANYLGHKLITSKRMADACDFDNEDIQYEYLSCKEGGSGQFDRMFSRPEDKRESSLERITRNHKIYIAIFYSDDQLKVKKIYEIEPNVMKNEAVRQLDKSRNDISHIGFNEKWAKNNGNVAYDGDKQ